MWLKITNWGKYYYNLLKFMITSIKLIVEELKLVRVKHID